MLSFVCQQIRQNYPIVDGTGLTIEGGTLTGIGGSQSTPTESACAQPVVIVGSQNFTAGGPGQGGGFGPGRP